MFQLMRRIGGLRRGYERMLCNSWKLFVTIRHKCIESSLNNRSIHRQTEVDPMSAMIYFNVPFESL